MPAKRRAEPSRPAAQSPAAAPTPFWHGAMWEPLPLARWTQWTDGDVDQPSPPLNEIIREQRARLSALPDRYLPLLRTLRDNIRHLIADKLQAPHQRVFRVHHERLVLELQERIEELERGDDLAEFERNIQPFVIAHAARLSAEQEGDASKDFMKSPSLPKSVIDAMVPAQQRLYRRMLTLIERRAGGAAASGATNAAAALSERGGDRSVCSLLSNESLVRQMFSRLWVNAHAPAAVHTLDHDLCQRCSIPMTRSTREQLLICSKCGFSMTYIDSTEAARTYGDDAEYNPNASHRFNHFQEFVTRAQAREVKPVPRGVLAKVAVHLRDVEGVASAEEITLEKVVRAVGDLGAPLREYKKNVVQICAQLSGRWPVQLTAEQTFMARSIFFEILNAFELLFPSEKWFRNKFVMSVICHTMGWDEMLRTLDAIEGGGGAAAAAAAQMADGELPSAAPAAPVPLAALRNVPRLEMEEAEMRMRAIFRHLGWQYRGPRVMMQQQGGAVGAGDGGDRAEESGAARALPFSHPTRA